MSFPYNVLNREFRDMTEYTLYPFIDYATLYNGTFEIPLGFLRDALFYAVGNFEAPFYLSDFYDTGDSTLGITIKDTNRNLIGSSTMTTESDTCFIKDIYNRLTGTIVYDNEQLENIIGYLNRQTASFEPEDTSFVAGVCIALPEKYAGSVNIGSTVFNNPIMLKGAGGVTFENEAGVIKVHLYGEEKEDSIKQPVRTINNIYSEHMWFAAHPDSSLRVVTKDTSIQIGHKRDF